VFPLFNPLNWDRNPRNRICQIYIKGFVPATLAASGARILATL